MIVPAMMIRVRWWGGAMFRYFGLKLVSESDSSCPTVQDFVLKHSSNFVPKQIDMFSKEMSENPTTQHHSEPPEAAECMPVQMEKGEIAPSANQKGSGITQPSARQHVPSGRCHRDCKFCLFPNGNGGPDCTNGMLSQHFFNLKKRDREAKAA